MCTATPILLWTQSHLLYHQGEYTLQLAIPILQYGSLIHLEFIFTQGIPGISLQEDCTHAEAPILKET